MKKIKQVPENKRKLNKIYVNTDSKGYPLTYSVKTKLSSGHIIKIEKNSRTPLKPFLKKYMDLLK